MKIGRLLDREFELFQKQTDGWMLMANFSTFMNFLCGAVILTTFVFQIPIPVNFVGRLIVFGASWDAIDGRFARRSKYKNPLGSSLDTAADLVTFGLAPGMIIISALSEFFLAAGIMAAALYLYAVSFRLSRFMIGGSGKSFAGMPSPVAAIFVSTFYVVGAFPLFAFASFITISLVMMSSLTYTAMKQIEYKSDRIQFILGIVGMLLYTYTPDRFYVYVAYFMMGYIYYFILVGPYHARVRGL